jgi:hypothetical protein
MNLFAPKVPIEFKPRNLDNFDFLKEKIGTFVQVLVFPRELRKGNSENKHEYKLINLEKNRK